LIDTAITNQKLFAFRRLQLAEAFNTLPELRRLATDPFVPALVRKKVVSYVLKDSKAHALTINLLGRSWVTVYTCSGYAKVCS
jgi:hypothetical protein